MYRPGANMPGQDRAIGALLFLGCAALPAMPAHAQAALDELPMLAEWKSPNTGMTTAIAVSRDGRYVLSGYYQQSILWDAQSGRALTVLRGHDGNVAVALLGGDRAGKGDPQKGGIVLENPAGRQGGALSRQNRERK